MPVPPDRMTKVSHPNQPFDVSYVVLLVTASREYPPLDIPADPPDDDDVEMVVR